MSAPHVTGLTRATLESAPAVCHACIWWQSRGGRKVEKQRWIEKAESAWGTWGTVYRDGIAGFVFFFAIGFELHA